jgi:riboflavin biosynthesis pyrimidine reductase
LLRAGGVDELFHCIAPKLAGEPDAPTMVTGVLHETLEMELVSLMENESHLFARFRLQ